MVSKEPEHKAHYWILQINVLYGQLPIELVAATIAMMLVSMALWDAVPESILLGWLGAMLALFATRGILYFNFRNRRETGLGIWPPMTLAMFMLAGALWAGVIIAGGLQTFGYPLGVTLFGIVCLSFSLLAIYPGEAGPIACFAGGALLAPSVYLALTGARIELTIAIMLCLFFAMLVLSAMRSYRAARALLELKRDHDRTLSNLASNRHEIEQLKVSLKSTNVKREETAAALERTSSDLHRMLDKTKSLVRTLEQVSPSCAITGIGNEKHLRNCLEIEWHRSMRDRKPLSLMLVAIDQPDGENNLNTSSTGIECLRRIADSLQRFARRSGDITARYGDNDFAIMLVGTDTKEALRIAQNVRQRIEQARIPIQANDQHAQVTVHVGVATVIPNRHLQSKTLMERADTALYEAGFQGSNRVVSFRALDKLRIERWHVDHDGPLSDVTLRHKLAQFGFRTPVASVATERRPVDRVIEQHQVRTTLDGQLRVTLEGQTLILKPGDVLFLTPGVTFSEELVGRNPITIVEAVQAA